MTNEEKKQLAEQVKKAWAALPEDQKARIRPQLEAAHEQLRTFRRTGKATHKPEIPHQLLQIQSILTDDKEQLLRAGAPTAEAVEISVSPGGDIWGTGKYQQLDLGWAEAFGVWLEHLEDKHPFPAGTPSPISMPDPVTIVLAGDFGTGNFDPEPSPSTKITNLIPSLYPDYTIHLGDVYYAGTDGQETTNLVNVWPQGSRGSFTMNSNHEMYPGAHPYFKEALGSQTFKLQAPFSFFALENSNWIIVGLDSAYFGDKWDMYMTGSLGSGPQVSFLKGLAQEGKKVIVLTHHNGLQEDGSAPTKLWNEVMSAFQGVAPPAYWYWGHVHAGIVYNPQSNGVKCRCTGHSALPWGFASELVSKVAWFEQRNAGDASDPVRVLNGFTLLQLNGASLTETFYDENGGVAWASAAQAAAPVMRSSTA